MSAKYMLTIYFDDSPTDKLTIMALFHCIVRHGTV